MALSPSSRRAWIEIEEKGARAGSCDVAFLAEGVDRNFRRSSLYSSASGRLPRGGRG